MNKALLVLIFCLSLSTTFLSGCDKMNHNFKELETYLNEETEAVSSDTNKHKNIYGFDNRNRVEGIDKNGYFEDAAGYKFDKYIKSDHFELYYNSDNKSNKLYAENSIEILESKYYRIINFFDADEKNIPIVKINMYEEYEQLRQVLLKEFRHDINLTQFISVGGFAVNTNTFYFITKYKERPVDLETLLIHEFTHNVTMALANKMRHDEWLWEGLAMYTAQEKDRYEPYYEDMINNGIPQLDTLKVFAPDRYKYGYSMVEYIVKEYGREKLIEIHKEYGDIEKVLNITENKFRDGWIEFLKSKI